ncbi:cytochrome P450 307a1-like [Periplaneta americana]|uniref:cytochrome P450 307a1-like n=1 Tax=Periplaneta americana TaxID=6978 RepID=UPI0037E850B8
MEPIFVLSGLTYILASATLLVIFLLLAENKHSSRSAGKSVMREAPGPKSWPIIGSLHLLGGYKVPYQAFSDLGRRYGEVVKLDLGSVSCMVVNGLENIREVLMTKGAHFDGRPNFRRYHQLFCGDKENSLAFCDWSEVQKVRREMLSAHTFPRAFSSRFHQLDAFVTTEMDTLISELNQASKQPMAIKPLLSHAMGNVFTSYFCSRRFEKDNVGFSKMVHNFDQIFYEVNQGYAADFMPWLLPLHGRHMAKIEEWGHEIREFMMKEIISTRFDNWTPELEEDDYVDALVDHVQREKQPAMTWDTAMFALEDIVGGHSAISNLLTKVLAYVATRPEVQRNVQAEVDSATACARPVTLPDRTAMPYTEAVILEAVRLIASPIVPHVANQDSSIAGFRVEKDTLIFLNNYELNMSPKLWNEPEAFKPERFLVNGRIVKPEHFLPFGGGRRSCMGYKMVQLLSFVTLASLLQNYHILPVEGHSYQVPIGNLALPNDTFQFYFIRR